MYNGLYTFIVYQSAKDLPHCRCDSRSAARSAVEAVQVGSNSNHNVQLLLVLQYNLTGLTCLLYMIEWLKEHLPNCRCDTGSAAKSAVEAGHAGSTGRPDVQLLLVSSHHLTGLTLLLCSSVYMNLLRVM